MLAEQPTESDPKVGCRGGRREWDIFAWDREALRARDRRGDDEEQDSKRRSRSEPPRVHDHQASVSSSLSTRTERLSRGTLGPAFRPYNEIDPTVCDATDDGYRAGSLPGRSMATATQRSFHGP